MMHRRLNPYIFSNANPRFTVTFFTARSNFATYALRFGMEFGLFSKLNYQMNDLDTVCSAIFSTPEPKAHR